LLKEVEDRHSKPGQYKQSREVKKVQQLYDTHNFWDSQPVPKSNDNVQESDFNKPIDKEKTVDEIRAEPLDIPPSFHWADVDISNDEECKEVYDLLT